MRLKIPDLSLVVLVGPSGAGKSTFAQRHFLPTEVLASDSLRAWVSDVEGDQSATDDAFDVLHFVAGKRLARGRLVVVDATNVQPHARKPLVALAKEHHVFPVAIVLDTPERVCHARNVSRTDREFGPHVIRGQCRDLRASLGGLRKEGFRFVHVLSPEESETIEIERVPLWTDRRDEHGPFDIIGDVHGCDDELAALLTTLGYASDGAHPDARKVVFLGDLVDRGPKVAEVLDRVMAMVSAGHALCLPGNHEAKPLRKLAGRDVKLTHGLAETMDQFSRRPAAWIEMVREFLDRLVSHYVLDAGRLVVAHAGLKNRYRAGPRVRCGNSHCTVTPPERSTSSGIPCVIRGPTNTAGRLPSCTDTRRCPRRGSRTTRFASTRAACSAARSPRCVGPSGRWFPCQRLARTTRGYAAPIPLPRPVPWTSPTCSDAVEAFDWYRNQGVERVSCQEKHVGSRAVLVVARDDGVARTRFGVERGAGVVLSRTGRAFFPREGDEAAVLAEVRGAVDWTELRSDWVVLDAEILPWTAKALQLVRDQYAPVGAATLASLAAASEAVSAAERGGVDLGGLGARTRERLEFAQRYDDAWRGYAGPADLRVAIFHVLASEGHVHADRDHGWHMSVAAGMAERSKMLLATRWIAVNPAQPEEAVRWWENLTAEGGEGMVVKPWTFVAKGRKGLLQPAVKCRGREYLRIIYGAEYTLPENLERLRRRGVGTKRALALREFALGLEGLERFVAGDSLRRVHECAFGVLALESEVIDAAL